MAEFKSFSDEVEVVGDVIEAFIAGFPAELVNLGLELLRNHGIDNPHRGEYYKLQSLLDAMREIQERFSSQMLYRIGESIAGNAKLPPGIDSLEICLASIDQAYHMNHRNGEIGSYDYVLLEDRTGLKRAKVVCPNPYPCSFDRGVIEGFSHRFKSPEVKDVLVLHDENEPCRRRGGESCTYNVSWG
jgi:hypothetical protein